MRGDLGERQPEASGKKIVLNPQERLQLQRTRVEELQKKFPNIAKARRVLGYAPQFTWRELF